FDDESSPSRKLRALWSLYVSGGASESWLRQLLDHESEPVRVWAVKLLVDHQSPSADVIREFTTRARSDASGLVLSFLAASLQRIPETQRWPLAEALSSRREFATDPVLPLMIWYGIESAVPKSPEPALKLAASSAIPKVRRFVARRLIQNGDSEKADERLVDLIARSTDSVLQADLLAGMSDALTGIRKATPPDNWRATAPALLRSANASVARLAEELSAVFGDGRALDALRKVVVDKSVDLAARRRALQTLVQSRADNLLPVAKSVFDEIDISADAIRGLATLAEAGTDRLLVNEYLNLKSGTAKMEAINTLASRPAFARTLLDAVQEGRIPRPDVTAVQIRQLRSLGDAEIDKRVTSLWPELRQLSADKQQQVQRYKQMLTAARMAGADRPAGRALYQQVCGTCHVLFGEGGKIGPDLTGSDRRNLDYLLENIIDPSGIVPDTYRMSVIDLKDGRVLNGIIGAKTEKTIAIQTPTEQLTLEKSEIETIAESKLSLMPEGLLESFNEQQVSDLIAYLMSPTQVPLNKTAEKSAP
ncbi:MAG: c-type cytochrome, partial [Verrucomicrobiota bacterium]